MNYEPSHMSPNDVTLKHDVCEGVFVYFIHIRTTITYENHAEVEFSKRAKIV